MLDDEIEIEIDESDLRVDTFRASGAGGQHVNKTDSAIRITHEPTGIVVSCQQERSQHKNRSTAMKMLKAALYQRAREEKEKEKQALESSKTEIAWGQQIRSYVFAPYTMVNDHRTDIKKGDVNAVMDGKVGSLHRGIPEEVQRGAGWRSGCPTRATTSRGSGRRVLEKLAALQERGVEPFAYSFDVTRHAAPSVAEFEEGGRPKGDADGDDRGRERTLGRPHGGLPFARQERLRGSGGPHGTRAGLLQAQRARGRCVLAAGPAGSGGTGSGWRGRSSVPAWAR